MAENPSRCDSGKSDGNGIHRKMKLDLRRDVHADNFTLGKLFIDDDPMYYTCEDAVREKKIPGQTAIPVGRYKVIVSFSQRFQKHLPLLLDVPNFSGVRIHSGNTKEDTEGCILIGIGRTTNGVKQSRLAMADFMPRLEYGLLNGDVWLAVS